MSQDERPHPSLAPSQARAQDAILQALRLASGEAVSLAQLNDAIYGDQAGNHKASSIPQYASALSRRLKAAGSAETIETVRGKGYRLRSPGIAIPAETGVLPPSGTLAPAEYRSALDRLGLLSSQAFCEEMERLGDVRPRQRIMHMAQWLKSERRTDDVPWFMGVIVRLLEREQAALKQNDALKAEAEAAARESAEVSRMLASSAAGLRIGEHLRMLLAQNAHLKASVDALTQENDQAQHEIASFAQRQKTRTETVSKRHARLVKSLRAEIKALRRELAGTADEQAPASSGEVLPPDLVHGLAQAILSKSRAA